jgi:hypothetical protein
MRAEHAPGRPDFCDHGVLPVITHCGLGVVAGCAFGMDDEAGSETACLGTAGEADRGALTVAAEVDQRRVVQQP